ncbi:MAG: hypothetical protein ABWZ57_05790 [Mesorhizobium sp.]
MKIQLAFLAGLSFALAGCLSSGGGLVAPAAPGNSPQAGKAGSGEVAQSIINAMHGGLVGGAVGRDLDRDERRQALEAEYRALEYTPAGQKVAWGNRAGGRYGEVVAASPYRVGSQDCRQYAHTVYTGGQPQKARGTACRNADGGWTPLT